MDKQMNITITPAGTITIDMLNFQGQGCAQASERAEVLLGGARANKQRKDKEEMYSSSINDTLMIKQVF